jgi:hypothetical protein
VSAKRGGYFWLSAFCAVIAIIGLLPVISLFGGLGLASALGCIVSEGGPLPCPFLGIDLGNMLLTMVLLGWLAAVTLPMAGSAFAVWLMAWFLRRRRRQMGQA